MLKLGYKIAPEQFPPSELLKQVIVAEEASFESIDASDHFHPWSEEGKACFIWSWPGAAELLVIYSKPGYRNKRTGSKIC